MQPGATSLPLDFPDSREHVLQAKFGEHTTYELRCVSCALASWLVEILGVLYTTHKHPDAHRLPGKVARLRRFWGARTAGYQLGERGTLALSGLYL
jgi:hypothetical protein